MWYSGTLYQPGINGVFKRIYKGKAYWSYWNGEFWGPLCSYFFSAVNTQNCKSSFQTLQFRGHKNASAVFKHYNFEDIKMQVAIEGNYKEEDFTPWFEAEVKPKRKGVYEVKGRLYPDQTFWSKWDGTQWVTITNSFGTASRNIVGSVYQDRKWRGLNAKPN